MRYIQNEMISPSYSLLLMIEKILWSHICFPSCLVFHISPSFDFRIDLGFLLDCSHHRFGIVKHSLGFLLHLRFVVVDVDDVDVVDVLHHLAVPSFLDGRD